MNDSLLGIIYANQKKVLPAFEIQLLICCSHLFPIELGKEVVYFLLDSSSVIMSLRACVHEGGTPDR